MSVVNMKKLRLLLLTALLAAAVIGQNGQLAHASECDSLRLGVVAKETITVSNSAIGFTAANLNVPGKPPTKYAIITTETDQIRWWDDGTAPTASVGHLVDAKTAFTICQPSVLHDFLMIRVTTDAKAVVSYYGVTP